ncbi:hypothetical protein AVEN_13203-1 [Araneus ventricosus]|uniref:Uncharacterized protein n=1 Tax=Araneus ventricosus TaxID=182803 RepID=A0A4Y2PDP7_ARAVE|nr:hypothetical protein AVEN_13203-1 [Araneus ventricosus]
MRKSKTPTSNDTARFEKKNLSTTETASINNFQISQASNRGQRANRRDQFLRFGLENNPPIEQRVLNYETSSIGLVYTRNRIYNWQSGAALNLAPIHSFSSGVCVHLNLEQREELVFRRS